MDIDRERARIAAAIARDRAEYPERIRQEQLATELRVEGLVHPERIAIPSGVRILTSGELEWGLPLVQIAPRRMDILRDFQRLMNAPDEDIAAFVNTYGFLGMHAAPTGFNENGLPMVYHEPLSTYRAFARCVSAIFNTASRLSSGELGATEDLRELSLWEWRQNVDPEVSRLTLLQWQMYERHHINNQELHDSLLNQFIYSWIEIRTFVAFDGGRISTFSYPELADEAQQAFLRPMYVPSLDPNDAVPKRTDRWEVDHFLTRNSALVKLGMSLVIALTDPLPKCAQCGTAFGVAGKKLRTDRRQFCSEECQKKAHRENMKMRQRKAREKNGQTPSGA